MVKSADPDIQLLAALADPTRMEILRELAGAPEVCACDFTDCCSVSQPTISHHLKVLRDAGAVVSERRGNWVFYRIAPNLIERLGGIAQGLVPGGMIPAAALARPRIRAGRRGAAASVGRPRPPPAARSGELDPGECALLQLERGRPPATMPAPLKSGSWPTSITDATPGSSCPTSSVNGPSEKPPASRSSVIGAAWIRRPTRLAVSTARSRGEVTTHVRAQPEVVEQAAEALGLLPALARQRPIPVVALPGQRIAGVGVAQQIDRERSGRGVVGLRGGRRAGRRVSWLAAARLESASLGPAGPGTGVASVGETGVCMSVTSVHLRGRSG